MPIRARPRCRPIWWRRRRGPIPPARRCGARRARQSDFALVRAAPRRGGAADARGGRGAGAGARPQPVRRADGWLPARHARRRRRSGVRRIRSVPGHGAAAGRGAAGRATRRRFGPPGRSRSRCRRRCAAVLPRGSGLDFAHARLDRSAHPFSGGTPTDVRITTRYDEADFTQSGARRGARDRACAVRAGPAAAHARASRWARRPAWRRTRASR